MPDGKSILKQNLGYNPSSSISPRKVVRKSKIVKGKRTFYYQVKLPFKRGAFNERVKKVLPIVVKIAKKYKLKPHLVLALIHTESAFNPRAHSSANAYGLMQLVPKSGGREAYLAVTGIDKKPTPRYLYNVKNNIELGCAYLNVLRSKYFKGVRSFQKMEYLIVSAYNTGPGNVSKAIINNRNVRKSIDKINNAYSDKLLFRYLKQYLPYRETRDYLAKVITRKKLYKK
jgi:membrane-bound lytic murein transglycosylase C